jgi:hypothetical protein
MLVFRQVEAGNVDWEWEDCAGYDEGRPGTGRARCNVVDGATEAYDSLRWVRQLVESFIRIGAPTDLPILDSDAVNRWFVLMQQRWERGVPDVFANIFEERTFHENGSFATTLCREISGLGGSEPTWTAVSRGDTVLFHVRDGRLVTMFPSLSPQDFEISPDGVFHPAHGPESNARGPPAHQRVTGRRRPAVRGHRRAGGMDRPPEPDRPPRPVDGAG